LPEEHPEAVGVVPAQRFLDALPVIIKIGDLVPAFLNPDPFGHLGTRLNNASNLVQDR
jgi:hypothetical protein